MCTYYSFRFAFAPAGLTALNFFSYSEQGLIFRKEFVWQQEYRSFDRRNFGIQTWDPGRNGYTDYTHYIYHIYYTLYVHYTDYSDYTYHLDSCQVRHRTSTYDVVCYTYDIVRQTYHVVLNMVHTTSYKRCWVRHWTYDIARLSIS